MRYLSLSGVGLFPLDGFRALPFDDEKLKVRSNTHDSSRLDLLTYSLA